MVLIMILALSRQIPPLQFQIPNDKESCDVPVFNQTRQFYKQLSRELYLAALAGQSETVLEQDVISL